MNIKNKINDILKNHSELETNLSSEAGRELLTNEILETVRKDMVDAIANFSKVDITHKTDIFESPDGGETVYKRKSGDYDIKELVTESQQLNLFDKDTILEK